jgi:hypothetical protein
MPQTGCHMILSRIGADDSGSPVHVACLSIR